MRESKKKKILCYVYFCMCNFCGMNETRFKCKTIQKKKVLKNENGINIFSCVLSHKTEIRNVNIIFIKSLKHWK